jgi:hypothetical protein
LWQSPPLLPICILAVCHAQDQHNQSVVVDLVHHAIVTDPR